MFVELSFRSGRGSGADDGHHVVSLAVRDGQQSTKNRDTEGDPTGLANRVVRIGASGGKRVLKDRASLLEAEAMLTQVGFSLRGVPVAVHGPILAGSSGVE